MAVPPGPGPMLFDATHWVHENLLSVSKHALSAWAGFQGWWARKVKHCVSVTAVLWAMVMLRVSGFVPGMQ